MLDFSYVVALLALTLLGLATVAWLKRPPLEGLPIARRSPLPVCNSSQTAGVLLLLALGASAFAAATAIVRLFLG